MRAQAQKAAADPTCEAIGRLLFVALSLFLRQNLLCRSRELKLQKHGVIVIAVLVNIFLCLSHSVYSRKRDTQILAVLQQQP